MKTKNKEKKWNALSPVLSLPSFISLFLCQSLSLSVTHKQQQSIKIFI